ncbi:MAG: cytidylate kinase-like family protein [Vicingaceae bacterium]
MKEDLLNYMNKRAQRLSTPPLEAGPVVTISREKGCPANTIANKLAQKLSELDERKSWRWVNRDILQRSAKELHLNESKINHILHSEDKGFFRDLILSFGEHYYQSDVKVKKTIAELITEFAQQGRVIIVGLGGVAIAKNVSKSLHIKLFAPYKYRLKEVERHEGMSAEKAREYMEETDVNRKMLIDYFNGIKVEDELFHAQFNCAILSDDEIVQSIMDMMNLKNIN